MLRLPHLARMPTTVPLVAALLVASWGGAMIVRALPSRDRLAATRPALLDTAILQPGDLIFRRGTSFESRAVRAASGWRAFSHVGLLDRTDSGWVVVHTLPAVDGDTSRGRAQRESLNSFLRPADAESIAVFRLRGDDTAVAMRAVRAANAMVSAALPFDDDFDLTTTDRAYCTELVLRAYEVAGVSLASRLSDTVALLGRTRVGVFPASLARSSRLRRVTTAHAEPP